MQHIDVAFFNKVREELQEKRDDEQSDMHTIDIGNGSHNDLVVSERFKAILNVESCLQ